ncbi:MAG: hypothetical protein RBG13Loki_2086 [Promethearchaeota archaeon CR_4]|nr:MAG: hypothetical protein RBG13Loki_2086 [Candidatus Lokiarchaeota archaeon CR_4]
MVTSINLPQNIRLRVSVSCSREIDLCPGCGAKIPVTTPEGFTVCSKCGLEYPDSQPYVCSDALGRDKTLLQSHAKHSRHTSTMIGSKTERERLAPQLKWAERVGRMHEQEVFQRAYFEIRKVLTVLDLNERTALLDAAMVGFGQAYRHVTKGSRNRNVHLLALVTVYRVLRAARVPVVLKRYLTACLDRDQHDAKQFMTVLRETTFAFPRTNPDEMVLHEISAIVSRLGLPKPVRDAAAAIAKHHVGRFQSPKTGVRAAAIVSAGVLATGTRAQFPLVSVARSAGIASSALIRCVTAACALCGRPITSSIISVGDLLRSLFVGPTGTSMAKPIASRTAEVKTRIVEIGRTAKLPEVVVEAALKVTDLHIDTFPDRVLFAQVGAILSTAVIASGSRAKCRLKVIARSAGTNYPTMAHYLKVACARLGFPLEGKLASSRFFLPELFLREKPPDHYEGSLGPPLRALAHPNYIKGIEGPPTIPTHPSP